MSARFANTPLSLLDRSPEIASVRLGVCDLNGVMRGKRLPISMADKALDGIALPMSTSLVDLWGADLTPSPYYDMGDPDGVAVPTGRLALPMPWLDPPSILLPASMMTAQGLPSPVDPRHILDRVVARYRAQGLTPVSAVELEFYVFDQQGRTPGGLADEGVLDLADLDRLEPFLAELEARCGEIGLNTGAALSEGGGGQVEVNLPHSPDPLEVADHAMMFRQVVRGVAQSQGLRATFMALPKLDAPGNGQHVHLSVLDGNGANIFDNGGAQGTQALRHAVGGVLAQMPDAALLFAPHENSHRRLHNGFAPSTVAWAYDSRFAAVRVPSGPPPARRIEHRVAGADANTYLVLAAISSAVLDGLSQKTDPPEPCSDQIEGPALPVGWVRTRDVFAQSPAMQSLMGEAHGLYVALRDQEMARIDAEMSELERNTLGSAL